ncbi:unnamed protein product [Protopolystoma xenopodis]|uniref:Uncharacterized protein n=1 Tax=Protopolystoma xenopodis TaxID=117903 RepID=A0A448X3K5_9PLAT|nr:unnamed protein product [Protopolystoma xenopodis]
MHSPIPSAELSSSSSAVTDLGRLASSSPSPPFRQLRSKLVSRRARCKLGNFRVTSLSVDAEVDSNSQINNLSDAEYHGYTSVSLSPKRAHPHILSNQQLHHQQPIHQLEQTEPKFLDKSSQSSSCPRVQRRSVCSIPTSSSGIVPPHIHQKHYSPSYPLQTPENYKYPLWPHYQQHNQQPVYSQTTSDGSTSPHGLPGTFHGLSSGMERSAQLSYFLERGEYHDIGVSDEHKANHGSNSSLSVRSSQNSMRPSPSSNSKAKFPLSGIGNLGRSGLGLDIAYLNQKQPEILALSKTILECKKPCPAGSFGTSFISPLRSPVSPGLNHGFCSTNQSVSNIPEPMVSDALTSEYSQNSSGQQLTSSIPFNASFGLTEIEGKSELLSARGHKTSSSGTTVEPIFETNESSSSSSEAKESKKINTEMQTNQRRQDNISTGT